VLLVKLSEGLAPSKTSTSDGRSDAVLKERKSSLLYVILTDSEEEFPVEYHCIFLEWRAMGGSWLEFHCYGRGAMIFGGGAGN